MKHISLLSVAVILPVLIGLSRISAADADYVLVAANIDSGRIDLWNMDAVGALSLRWQTDYGTSVTTMSVPYGLGVSKSGNYMFIFDWYGLSGLVFSVTPGFELRLLKEITGRHGCVGGVFTLDDRYFLTASGFRNVDPLTPRTDIYAITSTSCDLVSSVDAETTGMVRGAPQITSRGEIIAGNAGPNGYLLGTAVFDFTPQAPWLALRQYVPDHAGIHSALSPQEDLFVITDEQHRNVIPFRRAADGAWAWGPPAANPPVPMEAADVHITPDGQYAVALASQEYAALTLYRITATKALALVAYIIENPDGGDDGAPAMAMTPDGRYIVMGRGPSPPYTFDVYQINREAETLEKVSSSPGLSPGVMSVQFLPQVHPAAAKNWDQYAGEQEAALARAEGGDFADRIYGRDRICGRNGPRPHRSLRAGPAMIRQAPAARAETTADAGARALTAPAALAASASRRNVAP